MSGHQNNKASGEGHRRKKQRTSALQEVQPVGSTPSEALGGKGAQTNAAPQRIGRRSTIDRSEFLRLLQQSLSSLGFQEVADHLCQASGVPTQTEQVQPPARRRALERSAV